MFSSFSLMMAIFGVGCLFSILVAVPNWPFYNRNPLEWLPVSARAADWAEAATTTKEPAATPSKKPRKPAKRA